ncbi:hypothetical protein UT300012_23570 [Paraclostridium bifermentans]
MTNLNETIVRSNVLVKEYNELKLQFMEEVEFFDTEQDRETNYLKLVCCGLGALAEEKGAWDLEEFAEASAVILGAAMTDDVISNANCDEEYISFFREAVDSEDPVELDDGNVLLKLIAEVLLVLEKQEIDVNKDLLLKKATMLEVIDALCGDIEITVKG